MKAFADATFLELCLQEHLLSEVLFFVDCCISVDVLVTDKVPGRDNLREEGFVSAHG